MKTQTAPNCNCAGCYGGPELFRHGAGLVTIVETNFTSIADRDAERAFQAKVNAAVAESKRRAAAIKATK